jgi:Fe-S-cluster-containing hydrogenase component 2
MPRKTVVVDYRTCEPEECPDGVCQAALVCEKKVLTQGTPYEMPDTKASMCLSCATCVPACRLKAIRVI